MHCTPLATAGLLPHPPTTLSKLNNIGGDAQHKMDPLRPKHPSAFPKRRQ